jgi:hypothetical protein
LQGSIFDAQHPTLNESRSKLARAAAAVFCIFVRFYRT